MLQQCQAFFTVKKNQTIRGKLIKYKRALNETDRNDRGSNVSNAAMFVF